MPSVASRKPPSTERSCVPCLRFTLPPPAPRPRRALGRGGEGAAPAAAADFLLRRLKLNGRPLLPPEGMPAPSVPLDAGCVSQLYHVSPRALSAGFSLDGALELGAASPPPGTGIGDHASLEITLGNYGLVSAAASFLRGGASPDGPRAAAAT